MVALLVLLTNVDAQKYNLAAGPRLGTELGLSVQYRLDKKSTLEGVLHNSFREDITVISLLYERHSGLTFFRRLNIYTGIGPHLGWYSDDLDAKNPVGVTAITGLEFTLGRMVLSWDFKPQFNISGDAGFLYSETAITLRHVFIKRKSNFRVNFWKDWNLRIGKKK